MAFVGLAIVTYRQQKVPGGKNTISFFFNGAVLQRQLRSEESWSTDEF
jgi:hypothetical protein